MSIVDAVDPARFLAAFAAALRAQQPRLAAVLETNSDALFTAFMENEVYPLVAQQIGCRVWLTGQCKHFRRIDAVMWTASADDEYPASHDDARVRVAIEHENDTCGKKLNRLDDEIASLHSVPGALRVLVTYSKEKRRERIPALVLEFAHTIWDTPFLLIWGEYKSRPMRYEACVLPNGSNGVWHWKPIDYLS